jgi:thiol:disulfide interchange protein
MKKNAVWVLVFIFLFGGCAYRGVQWRAYTPEDFEAARNEEKPLVVYFYAAWCPTCYELRDKTLTDVRIVDELMSFERLRADMSHRYSPRIQELARQFHIRGYPTLVFYGPRGDEIRDLRVTGFISSAELLEVIHEMRRRYPSIPPAPLESVS